jgi:hypothetical protein
VNPDPAVVALREALEQRLDELADEATEKIVAEIPAYRAASQQLRDDVRAHVVAHIRASVTSLGGRDLTREDLLFVRPHAARRAKRIPLADFVHAFYIGERVLWDAVVALAVDDESRRAALVFASHQPRYFEVATTHAAEVYLEAQEQLAVTGERIRRDLLESLLTGRGPEPGPRLDAARAAGLRDGAACLVISAVPVASPVDEQLLRGGAASLARACAARMAPLAVVRQDEIVVVVATDGADVRELRARLDDALARLAGAGLPLVVGISTVVGGVGQILDAYREATLVRVTRDSQPGVASLAGMSAFEYLTLRPDPTAHRLIAPAIHEFVAQDAEEGAPLVATLRAYVACDLNVRKAAEQLHIHVNTAHYRLARIAERSGCDLRRIEDLMEVLIAARLADAEADAPAGTAGTDAPART